MNFTQNEKYALITVLNTIMKADGVIEHKEQKFMDHIYRKLGVTIDDLQTISQMEVDDCKPIFDAMPADKKELVSKCLLEMVGIDGHVDLRELRVLHNLI